VQKSGTDLLIYSVPQIIAFCSDFTPLVPGDVIATGTPDGVGHRPHAAIVDEARRRARGRDLGHRHLAQPRRRRDVTPRLSSSAKADDPLNSGIM
jgi:2-keto-4-pentenoate hydratase/2-oxohepta-3-ene-1,7-dioic acid hydratase in catechol pathway